MIGSAAGTAFPTSVRFALLAIALDVAAVASFVLAVFVAFDLNLEGALPAFGFVVLALLVPPLATLAALAASVRSVSESKKPLAKILASALAVVSVGILLLWGVLAFSLLQSGGGD